MAKRCDCHRNLRKAMAEGMDFHEANAIHGKARYHEHRCECPCGCAHDTLGYKYCPSCHWDLIERRGKHAAFEAKTSSIAGLVYFPVLEGEETP